MVFSVIKVRICLLIYHFNRLSLFIYFSYISYYPLSGGIFFFVSGTLTSTRITSSPILHMHFHPIVYSFSRPNRPQNFPAPGIINWQIQPDSQSNSKSATYPRRCPSRILMTSFWRKSHIRIHSPAHNCFFYL